MSGSHSKKVVSLTWFLTRKYGASVTYGAVVSISSSDATEGPRTWKRQNVYSRSLAASRKPISSSAFKVGPRWPARTSSTLTLRAGVAERVDDLHLIARVEDVDDLGEVGMEALEGAARPFGVEGARRRLARRQIVEEQPRHGGLADAALVGSNDDERRIHGENFPFVCKGFGRSGDAYMAKCAESSLGLICGWFRRGCAPRGVSPAHKVASARAVPFRSASVRATVPARPSPS